MTLQRALSLVLLHAKVSVQNFTAYRFDLLVRCGVSLMHVAAELVAVWTIFIHTKELNTWTWKHMLILAGVYRIVAGGIRILIVPNMRKVLEDIQKGTLDFVLLRPVNSQFLVSIREFVVWRIVDVIFGTAVAITGCVLLAGTVPIGQALMFVLMLAASFAIVYSIWLMLATMCFWFIRVQNIEMVFWNVFEAGRFPIHIYQGWVQWMLTYIVPLAFITTFPAASLTGDSDKMRLFMIPIAVAVAAAMLVLSNRFWRFGLRHYSGASA